MKAQAARVAWWSVMCGVILATAALPVVATNISPFVPADEDIDEDIMDAIGSDPCPEGSSDWVTGVTVDDATDDATEQNSGSDDDAESCRRELRIFMVPATTSDDFATVGTLLTEEFEADGCVSVCTLSGNRIVVQAPTAVMDEVDAFLENLFTQLRETDPAADDVNPDSEPILRIFTIPDGMSFADLSRLFRMRFANETSNSASPIASMQLALSDSQTGRMLIIAAPEVMEKMDAFVGELTSQLEESAYEIRRARAAGDDLMRSWTSSLHERKESTHEIRQARAAGDDSMLSGLVTLDGEPLIGATTSFYSMDGEECGSGVTDDAGKYRITASAEHSLPQGDYRVVIRKAEVRPDDGEAEDSEANGAVPQMFTEFTTSPLMITWQNEVHFDFDLMSGAGRSER